MTIFHRIHLGDVHVATLQRILPRIAAILTRAGMAPTFSPGDGSYMHINAGPTHQACQDRVARVVDRIERLLGVCVSSEPLSEEARRQYLTERRNRATLGRTIRSAAGRECMGYLSVQDWLQMVGPLSGPHTRFGEALLASFGPGGRDIPNLIAVCDRQRILLPLDATIPVVTYNGRQGVTVRVSRRLVADYLPIVSGSMTEDDWSATHVSGAVVSRCNWLRMRDSEAYYDPLCDDPDSIDPVPDDDDDDDDDDDYYGDEFIHDYHSCGSARSSAVRRHPSESDDPLKDDTLTLGFECEVNVVGRREFARGIVRDRQIAPYVLMERDGSLDSDDGVEIITGWSTLGTVRQWASHIARHIDDYETYLSGCGFHITTGPLPGAHVRRIASFIYAQENAALVRAVAGRDFNGYAENAMHNFSSAPMSARVALARIACGDQYRVVYTTDNGGSRYRAINVRSDDTIEWRIFAGATSERTMHSRLEFVWALTKFCSPDMLRPLTTPEFCAALADVPFLQRHTPALRQTLSAAPPTLRQPKLTALAAKDRERAAKRVEFERKVKTKSPA